MAYPFIVIEGLDGVGKTTCGKLLALQCSAHYTATPMHPFTLICKEVDEIEDLNSRFHFFLSAVVSASAVIKRLLTTQTVICDRYIFTTLAYHRAMGVSTTHLDFKNLPIVFPTYTFLLSASEEVRHQRLLKRRLSLWDKKFLDPSLVSRLKNEFQRFDTLNVDTTDRSPEEVVGVLLSKIREVQTLW